MPRRFKFSTTNCIVLLFSVLFGSSQALICFENDEQGGIKEVENKDWSYCMLIPQTASNFRGGRLFGVGPVNDYTMLYDDTFSVNSALYKILSMCILERYNLSPLFQHRKMQPEFLFRCVCNYDRCNSEANFQNYLSAIVKENN